MSHNIRYQQARRATLIGAVVNATLGISKLIGGWFFHSHALIADGLHSFSDLIVDAMVVFASKYGSLDADATHPYGHQRIETATTLFLALILILAGLGIAWDSLYEILAGTTDIPGVLAIPIAVFSILANEVLFYYTRHVGNRIQSSLLVANAWHHRSDAGASLVVLLGLIGSILGASILDPIAAIIVGALIVKMGINYGWSSVKELVDTAIDPNKLTQITEVIHQIEGVNKIHQLRSRMMGQDILIDLHVLVDPTISVSEGHYIAQHVHRALRQQIKGVKDVTVHIDPEDDETAAPSAHLLKRSELEYLWLKRWQVAFPAITNWVVHYLSGRIHIDLIFDSTFDDWSTLKQYLHEDLAKQQEIASLRLLSQHATLVILPD